MAAVTVNGCRPQLMPESRDIGEASEARIATSAL